MNQSRHAPQLPEPILLDEEPSPADSIPMLASRAASLARPTAMIDPQIVTPRLFLRSLKHGCYFLQWTPPESFWYRFNGTMRMERHGQGTTASGDLYHHQAFKFTHFPSFRIAPNPDPSPSAGIPIFARANYRY